jgi:predicted peptidase
MPVNVLQYGAFECLVSQLAGVGPWPVLCFLHGSQEAAPAPIVKALTSHGPLRTGSSPLATTSFIVVAPQLPPPGGNVWAAYAVALQDAVRAVPNSDAGARYLSGFSFGANGVLNIGRRQPGFWAALWAVDPTEALAAPSPRPLWLSAGQYSRPREAAFRQALAGTAADFFVYEDRGLDHVGTATSAFADDAVYSWLLNRRLE